MKSAHVSLSLEQECSGRDRPDFGVLRLRWYGT